MVGQPLVLRGRPFSWRDVPLLMAILVALSAGVASAFVLILDLVLHTYLSLSVIAIIMGFGFIVLAALSGITLIFRVAVRIRRVGMPLLETGDDGIWVQRFSAYRIPWSRIDRIRLRSNNVSLLTVDPTRNFALQKWPSVLDRLRGSIWFQADEFDMDAEDLRRRLKDECRAHGCVFEESSLTFFPASRVGYACALLCGLFGLSMLVYGAGQLERGWSMMMASHIEVAAGRVFDVSNWHSPGQKRDFIVSHDILTFKLEERSERFSIHDYEPGYEQARSVIRPGRTVTVVAEPNAERNQQGHRVLYLHTQGMTLTDRVNSWLYKAWVLAWLILETSAWLMAIIGGYLAVREIWKRFRRRVAPSVSP